MYNNTADSDISELNSSMQRSISCFEKFLSSMSHRFFRCLQILLYKDFTKITKAVFFT